MRVHQDIVLNTSTLVDAEELVLVLPAQTRYESGGTSTSTERRVRYSPEIEDPDGANIPEARAEWLIPALIGRALEPAHKQLFAWQSPADVRAEMGRTMPLYAGIEGLARRGAVGAVGRRASRRNGFPNMPDGRARFSVVPIPTPELPEGKLLLATRRGKQFNSITYGKDPITASARRDVVLFHADDLAALGIAAGERVVLRSDAGVMEATARPGPCRRRHAQAFWPEANVLLGRVYDPVSGEPDYNAVVTVERAATASRTSAAASPPPAAPPAAPKASSPPRASSGRG